jgi:hypothetical protein
METCNGSQAYEDPKDEDCKPQSPQSNGAQAHADEEGANKHGNSRASLVFLRQRAPATTGAFSLGSAAPRTGPTRCARQGRPSIATSHPLHCRQRPP